MENHDPHFGTSSRIFQSTIEDPKIVDSVKCGCVIRAQCLLPSSQCMVIHSLCIFELALICVQIPKDVDSVKCGCVIRAQCLLITSQCMIIHSLCIFES